MVARTKKTEDEETAPAPDPAPAKPAAKVPASLAPGSTFASRAKARKG